MRRVSTVLNRTLFAWVVVFFQGTAVPAHAGQAFCSLLLYPEPGGSNSQKLGRKFEDIRQRVQDADLPKRGLRASAEMSYNKPEFRSEEFPITEYITGSRYSLVTESYRDGDFFIETSGVEWRSGLSDELQRRLVEAGVCAKARACVPRDSAEGRSRFALAQAIKREATMNGKRRYSALIDEYVEFALKNYKRRKWPADFREKLYKMAYLTADSSRWVGIRERLPNGEPGELVGVFRMIYLPFGKVQRFAKDPVSGELTPVREFFTRGPYHWTDFRDPGDDRGKIAWLPLDGPPATPAESYLGRQIGNKNVVWIETVEKDGFVEKRGIGLTIEPGNFAIRQDVNDQIFVTVAMHLQRAVFDPRDERVKDVIEMVTYNDLPPLYTPLGFEKEGDAAISKDGVAWWPLVASGPRMQGLIDRIARLRSFGDDRLSALRRQFEDMMAHDVDRLTADRRFVSNGPRPGT